MTKDLLAGAKIHYHNVTQRSNVTQEQIIKLNKIFPMDGQIVTVDKKSNSR